jgi:NADPH:quinone reductase-like Zn-dependent oxidoreductase/acyl carrier protein
LVFADEGGVANAVLARLRAYGHDGLRVRRGDGYRAESPTEFTIAANAEDDLRRLWAHAAEMGSTLAGVIHCWSLDHPPADGLDIAELQAAQRTGVLHALHLIHTLPAPAPRVWFLTRDVYRVVAGDRATGLASAPLSGLLRVANNELTPTRLTLIDLDAAPAEDAAEQVLHEISRGDDELEVAYRGGRRHALRLRRVGLEQLPMRRGPAVRPDGSCVPFRLQTDRPGILNNLALHETHRRAPGPDEIELRVHAGGLNFRDVMKALGTYPGNPVDRLWFGDDVAGTVERVGVNVRHLQPGDAVVAMVPYGFQSFVTAPARLAFPKPPGFSWEQAATLPTVFLTAHYALVHLARVQPGERILIHGGAGGVGQAAIQIARLLGLEVFATGGTPEKRRWLAEMGVPHVLNSRTLEFADQILELTAGRGVDVVLNSLAGDFIPKSLSVLAPFGRFLEIGKIDVYRNSTIGLQQLKDNISYFIIDLAQYLREKPAAAERLLAEVSQRFVAGDYQPLSYTTFPVTEVVEAFRYMAQGKHMGKIVLSFAGDGMRIGPVTDDDRWFRAAGTYLITGGAGGFCLEVAKWMARHGARQLALLSRSGPRDDAAARDIEQLRAGGCTVIDARGDVTRLPDVVRVIRQIQDEWPPLQGVVHGAMVLDDDFLVNLDDARFQQVQDPKMAGAWNLHAATRELPLEHFICFSSFSTSLGAPKQSAYNAGNFFLDALAQYRRAGGLPALTVDWGAIRGAGFVERNPKTAEYLEKVGLPAFRVVDALRVLGRLLPRDPVQVAAARVDWRLVPVISPVVVRSPTFTAVAQEGQETDQGGTLVARLRAASPETRLGLIEKFMAAQVAGVFGIAEDKVDRATPLTNLGLDSLMAIELKNRIEQEAGITLPMMEIMHGPSLSQLAKVILKSVADSEAPNGAAPAAEVQLSPSADTAAAEATALLEKIDELSEAQIDALLATVEETGDGQDASETSRTADARRV